MEEATWNGKGSVIDASGQGNNGTPSGTAATTASGKFGRAASFDGSGWIDVPDSASLHVTNKLTYSAWIRPTGLDGNRSPGVIAKRQAPGTNVAFTLFLWSNDEAWVDVQGTRFNSNAVFTNGTWYHLAVVYDGDLAVGERVQLYVNGARDSVADTDPTLATNTQDVLIGNLPNGGDMFIGQIDEVAIWARALSGDEVAALYHASGPL
jgi:hypothetical protein